MTRRQRLRAQVTGRVEQVVELYLLVAADAGNRRLPGDVAVGEGIDHRVLEALLVVEHVMRNAERLGDAARVVDVLPRAAGAGAVRRLAVVVKLQRHPDDVVASFLQEPGDNRGIHAARHGDDHAGILGPAGNVQIDCVHGYSLPKRVTRRSLTLRSGSLFMIFLAIIQFAATIRFATVIRCCRGHSMLQEQAMLPDALHDRRMRRLVRAT